MAQRKGQDESDTPDPDVPTAQLIVPFVQDTKNALLIGHHRSPSLAEARYGYTHYSAKLHDAEVDNK